LSALGGHRGARRRDCKDYALGTRLPDDVETPATLADLAALLRACDERGRAAVLFGGRTLQGLGAVPKRYDLAIDCTRLDRVVEHEPRDLTIALEAGCRVAALDAALAACGQFVPLDAPRAAAATIGGTLASGWLGPRRATYGRARDFVIGTTVALADGTIAKAGGMVVKNVTGYDLSKLYVGSLGTLAAIGQANFKTLPLPAARRLAVAPLPEGTRVRTIANLAALAIEPAAALIVAGFAKEIDAPNGADGSLVVLLEGSERTVDAATRELRSALGAAGVPQTRLIDREAGSAFARVLDAYIETLGSRSMTYRSLGLPSDTTPRLDAFARVARANRLTLETIEDVRTGDVIARLSARLVADFATRAKAFDGERRTALAGARILVAPEKLRAGLDVWGAPPASLPLMRTLKTRFDPNGTLAPGRYVGGI
jgi:glycolate oxidase FAD binding subunit